MMRLCHTIAVACGLCFLINEVSGAYTVLSRAEIMANMTPKLALQTVLSSDRTRKHPELIAFLQSAFNRTVRNGEIREDATLLQAKQAFNSKAVLRGSAQNSKKEDNSARDMLSNMTKETFAGLEEENFRCESYDARTTRQMRTMRNAVVTFNAQAASARACVVGCTGTIATFTETLQTVEEDAARFKKDCDEELFKLQDELRMVESDITVMNQILDSIKCGDEAVALFQCRDCQNAIMLHQVPTQLAKLRSAAVRSSVQKVLSLSYEESLDGKKPIALAQRVVERMRRQKFSALATPADIPEANLSVVPELPAVVDCQPTTKCSIGNSPNCGKLKGRFLNVATNLMDKQDELKEAIGERSIFCDFQTARYKEQIESMNTKLRETQTRLAECTGDQNEAERNSHHNAGQLTLTSTEYTKTMTTCCNNQNEAKSQLCALGKIRGELLKINNQEFLDIVDCEVSEWRAQECSASCGGGTRTLVRSVLIQEQGGGMECPPLEATESCNEDDCPVNCQLGDWGGWSSCSADCGGGVMQRERPTNVEPVNGGEACEQTSDTQGCNIESCDVDCVLSDWSDWSDCSKACEGGVQTRTKTIVTPAAGMGHCWGPSETQRLHQKPCDLEHCSNLITDPTREILHCHSKVDVVIVLDGSASLGTYGWQMAQEATEKMVENLGAGSDGTGDAQVSVLLYGGPLTMDDYKLCVGITTSPDGVDMKANCGMEWIGHLTNNTATLKSDVEKVEWPASTTMTSLALSQAEAELFKGRSDASSVVILVTDGWPMSRANTNAAAEKLQESAKVIYVPVGHSAPLSLIEDMATEPKEDHIIQAHTLWALNRPNIINKIIGSTCTSVN